MLSHTTITTVFCLLSLVLPTTLAARRGSIQAGIQRDNVAGQASPNQASFGSTQYPIEQHHSLRPPIDKSQVYWSFGGASVLTKYLLRLTPSTQDRRGWLWNEYPLESTAFEIEYRFEVASKPHFGGDGMAMWLIKPPSEDPSFAQQVDAFNGPVFGMNSNFNGVGILIDVYDNDAKRNNPAVFAISNDGQNRNFNHDNDFADDMIKTTSDTASSPGSDSRFAAGYASHRCVADVRNTGKTAKMMIRFLHKNLHVYVDSNDGNGYKFCLAVTIDRDLKDHHIAFTAATGQVADTMDLHEVTTRYLKESDSDIDDTQFTALAGSGSGFIGGYHNIYWFLVNAWNIGLLGLAAYMLNTLRTLTQQRIDAVYIAQTLNTFVLPHYAAHAAFTLFLLLSASYTGFLINTPMVAWRVYEIVKRKYKITPAMLVASKGHAVPMLGNTWTQLSLTIAFYSIVQLYCLFRWVV